MKKTIGESENQVIDAVCDYLALKKHLFWRANNVPVFDGKNFRRMPKYAMKGVPDINLIINGQYIGIECKKKGGILSADQKEFEKKCRKSGSEYYVIRDFIQLKELGI